MDLLWDSDCGSENVLCCQRLGFKSLCYLLVAMETDITLLSPSVKGADSRTYIRGGRVLSTSEAPGKAVMLARKEVP